MTIQRQHFHILWTAIMALVLTLTVLPASPAKAQPTPAMKELQRYVQETVPLKWEQQMEQS
jgi:hypothetical protein